MINNINSITDDLLVAEIKENNKEAFKSLYDRYSRKIYYFSLRYLGSKEETEELLQSIFMNIWQHRRSLDSTLSVKDYIFRSAVNYITNYLKKKAVRTRFNESEIHKGEIQSNQTYEQVLLHDLESLINSIVETLPSQQQKIFRLSRYEGLTHKEIASKLGLSVRTVENQMYRVLKVLRKILKADYF
jgi:RNA polymerase sigma-70 factor (ECF subfamily)